MDALRPWQLACFASPFLLTLAILGQCAACLGFDFIPQLTIGHFHSRRTLVKGSFSPFTLKDCQMLTHRITSRFTMWEEYARRAD